MLLSLDFSRDGEVLEPSGIQARPELAPRLKHSEVISLGAELVRLKVDVIFGNNTPTIQAAKPADLPMERSANSNWCQGGEANRPDDPRTGSHSCRQSNSVS
jgi:hypothetical protein